MKSPVQIVRDDARDCVTIDGHEYSGDFFRFFGSPDHDGRYFQLALTEQGWAIRQLETRWARFWFWVRWEPAVWWARAARKAREAGLTTSRRAT